MHTTLSSNWRFVALRGLCAIGFGISAYFWPENILEALGILLGIYMLADGLLSLIYALRSAGRRRGHRKLLIAEAGISILIGMAAILWPHLPAIAAAYLVAAWAILTGVFQMLAGIELRHAVVGSQLLVFCGIASLVCGLLLLAFPLLGAITFLWLLGTYMLAAGILLVALAYQLWQRQKQHHSHHPAASH